VRSYCKPRTTIETAVNSARCRDGAPVPHRHETCLSEVVLGELVLRFLLGGAIVSAFAMFGTLFKPKTFAGLFGAAPSVAIATLGLAFHQNGAGYAAIEARAMVCGIAAMLVYCAACIALAKRRTLPVWLAAALSWFAWLAVAFAALTLVRWTGLS
jgi:hypothetical protein